MIFKYEIKTTENNEKRDMWDIRSEFTCAQDPKSNEKIQIEIEEEQKTVSIVANKDGWEYLAKVCIEMSLCAELDPNFHIHRKADMHTSDDESQDKVSFFID